MSDYDYLPINNGSGDAALAHITANRAALATTINVDTVLNWPQKFIGTYGTLLATGFIDPTTKRDFKGHLATGTIVIDSFEPGNVDAGNTSGQVVVIKPNTGWGSRVATAVQAAFARTPATTASSATPTPNSDITSQYDQTAQAAAAAFGVPSGTPVDGQSLIIRIKDNGTARALTWNAIYRALGVALPTTTIISKTLYCGFIYNIADTKWDLVAVAQEA